MEPLQSLTYTTGMSPELYEAAMIGNIEIIRHYKYELDRQFTPTKNTLLHVLAQFTDCGQYIKEILNFDHNIQTLQSILLWVNMKGESALHIAARKGKIKIVNALLLLSKNIDKEDVESGGEDDTITRQMLRMKTKVGNTALHETIKFNHRNVAELLLKEDPEFVYPSNNMAETPLYIAAENGNCAIVRLILNTCKSSTPSCDGPCNRTALHAAILHDCEGCTGALLKSLPFLTKKADASGWSALHLAARTNFVSRVNQLLDADPSLAYVTASQDNNKTALHVATAMGNVEAMSEILRNKPDCWEINTSDDRNLLHIGVDHERLKATKFILGKPWGHDLADAKDFNGDTPLHLYAVSTYELVPGIADYAADINACNKENLNPIDLLEKSDVFSYHEGSIRKQLTKSGARQSLRSVATDDNNDHTRWKKMTQEKRKRATFDSKRLTETYIIVSTLIAAVTFAAGFSLPGGYDGNNGPHQGMAVLSRKVAFKAFVVSNTIAVISSILAVFYLLLATSALNETLVMKSRKGAAFLLRGSVVAMLIAFTTGSYCALDYSSGLQISVSILGGGSILAICYLIVRLLLCSAFPRALARYILSSIVRFMRKHLKRCTVWLK